MNSKWYTIHRPPCLNSSYPRANRKMFNPGYTDIRNWMSETEFLVIDVLWLLHTVWLRCWQWTKKNMSNGPTRDEPTEKHMHMHAFLICVSFIRQYQFDSIYSTDYRPFIRFSPMLKIFKIVWISRTESCKAYLVAPKRNYVTVL